MYDNLIRRDPRDSGQTIIPDLAHSWEIAKDGKTYTFFLRQGVVFHDGAELTADDVKATYDRIVKPPQGVSIPRTPLFATVMRSTCVTAILSSSSCTNRGRRASSWAPLPAAGILSCAKRRWKTTTTTYDKSWTSWYRSVQARQTRRQRSVVQERNPNYWHDGLPYLDGIEFYHFPPFSPELGAALLSGRVDYARLLDPVSLKRVTGNVGHVWHRLLSERYSGGMGQQHQKAV